MKAIVVRPCPCQTRKSRIHLRVCGARRDGRGRMDGGGGRLRVGRDNFPQGLAIFAVSQCLLAATKMTGLLDGSCLRTRTMPRCRDPTALPLGGSLYDPFIPGTRAVCAPRSPPPPPTGKKEQKRKKGLWQPHIERDCNVKGSSTPTCRSKRQFPGSPETGR